MAVEALDLELRQKAKAMIAHGSSSADVARVPGLHPGTVREWKLRFIKTPYLLLIQGWSILVLSSTFPRVWMFSIH